MIRTLSLIVSVTAVMVVPAFADPDVGAGNNTFFGHDQKSEQVVARGGQPVGATGSYVRYESKAFCSRDPSLTDFYGCGGPQSCGMNESGMAYNLYGIRSDGSRDHLGTYCDEDGDVAPDSPGLTLAMIAEAFRRVPLPASTISIQPPGGRTLVNLPTILSTDAAAFTETVTLLGQRVTLDITPTSYRWVHGDSTEQTSDWAGVAYAKKRPMSDYLAHTYLRADPGLPARVDTTWSARFRVNGGPWRPVPDTVTIAGEPVSIEVVEASPILVGYE